MFSSCKDDEESTSGYDQNKPIVLTDFYPPEGKLATQVILNGSNFGDSLRIYIIIMIIILLSLFYVSFSYFLLLLIVRRLE